MCNICAVKLHQRDHKVEELENIVKKGFITSLLNLEQPFNKDQFLESILRSENLLNESPEEETAFDVEADLSIIIKLVEENLRNILKSFN